MALLAGGKRGSADRAAVGSSRPGDVPDIGTLRQLWRFREYGRAELRSLLLGTAMRGLELVADLAAPWPLALVINGLQNKNKQTGVLGYFAAWFGGSAVAMLVVAAVATLVFTALSALFDYLGDRIMNSAGERITSRIRTDVFSYIDRLPMGFHDRQSIGELTTRVIQDTGKIQDSLVDLFSTFFPAVLTLFGTAAFLIALDWRLGLIGLCVAPLVFLVANHYARLTRQTSRKRRAAVGKLTGFVTESLQGMRTIHAFGSQDSQEQRFGQDNREVLQLGLRSVDLSAQFSPVLQVIAAFGTAGLLFVGGYGALVGWWQVGVLVVATTYLKNMVSPMKSLAKLAPSFTQGAASAERVAAILDQPRDHLLPEAGLPARVRGEIELKHVGLDYGRGPVLWDLSLEIHAGERIALQGENGAGKSTTLSLIGGLYRPTEGEVLLDGLSVPDVPEPWLHAQVAMVLQETFLFSGTLADNLRYGRDDATDEEVARVAEAALVTEFAHDLPDGLDTRILAGGIGLSGGQRQRVGIARALLMDAPVVLLDEPTVGLDAHAEEDVVQALIRLMEGRTVLMTTHQAALTALATRSILLTPCRVLDEAPPCPTQLVGAAR